MMSGDVHGVVSIQKYDNLLLIDILQYRFFDIKRMYKILLMYENINRLTYSNLIQICQSWQPLDLMMM